MMMHVMVALMCVSVDVLCFVVVVVAIVMLAQAFSSSTVAAPQC